MQNRIYHKNTKKIQQLAVDYPIAWEYIIHNSENKAWISCYYKLLNQKSV